MDLSKINLPAWLPSTVRNLMNLAEEVFGPGTGATKKAWVRTALLDAAKSVDVRAIPNWIENPAKELLVDFIIEVIWGLHFRPHDFGGAIERSLRGA
jgi:hypothetical protein